MARQSRKEQAKIKERIYRKRISEKAKKGSIGKPETDEFGIYLALKYDKEIGNLCDPFKIKQFQELNQKYGQL